MPSIIIKDIEIKAVFTEWQLVKHTVENTTITSIIETAIRGEGVKPWGVPWDAFFKKTTNDYDTEWRPVEATDVQTDLDYAMEFDNIYLS